MSGTNFVFEEIRVFEMGMSLTTIHLLRYAVVKIRICLQVINTT